MKLLQRLRTLQGDADPAPHAHVRSITLNRDDFLDPASDASFEPVLGLCLTDRPSASPGHEALEPTEVWIEPAAWIEPTA